MFLFEEDEYGIFYWGSTEILNADDTDDTDCHRFFFLFFVLIGVISVISVKLDSFTHPIQYMER